MTDALHPDGRPFANPRRPDGTEPREMESAGVESGITRSGDADSVEMPSPEAGYASSVADSGSSEAGSASSEADSGSSEAGFASPEAASGSSDVVSGSSDADSDSTDAASASSEAVDGGAGAAPRRQRHAVLSRGAIICGVLSLLVILSEVGAQAFVYGLVLAVVPVPVYVALALWLDRFEPEPARTLAQTFAWGASVAVFLALIINTVVEGVAAGVLGDGTAEVFGAIVTAPLIEELSKGLALLFLFHELKDEFDGVVDGVVYAAMVGLGFAMIENVKYYGDAVGDHTSVLTFAIRGLMGPFAHPLFTSMFGIGLGYARERHGTATKFSAPLLGFIAAVALHSLWNMATTADALFVGLYIGLMVPAFLAVLLLINRSLGRESRIIHCHLAGLVESGVLTPAELERLCVVRHRLADTFRAWRVGGVPRWRERRELHRIASELAFHRWRVERGITLGAEADAARDREYLLRLEQLCARSRAASAARAAA